MHFGMYVHLNLIYLFQLVQDNLVDGLLEQKGSVNERELIMGRPLLQISKMNTTRLVLATTIQYGWKLHWMDVKGSFLNEDLGEDVYMYQP